MKYLLVILLLCQPLHAAITPDTSTATTGGITNGTVVTFNHTVNSGCTSPVLQVSVAWQEAVIGSVSSVSYNSVSATTSGGGLITGVSQVDPAIRVEMWYLKNPTHDSAAHPLTVTMDGEKNSITVSAMTWCGVHQTTSIGTPVTNSNSDDIPTVAVTSATGELVVDAAFVSAVTLSAVGAGQTQRSNFAQDVGNHVQGTSSEAGAASVTMSWTMPSSNYWGIVGVSLKPAAASSSVAPILLSQRRRRN